MTSFAIRFGALSPPILEQLGACGLKLDMDPCERQRLQRDADGVTRLKVRGILTDREADAARKRIVAIIKKQAKPL